MDKFLHMTIFFSTGTARGARDKYVVWEQPLTRVEYGRERNGVGLDT